MPSMKELQATAADAEYWAKQNTRQLADTALSPGTRAYHLQTGQELDAKARATRDQIRGKRDNALSAATSHLAAEHPDPYK